MRDTGESPSADGADPAALARRIEQVTRGAHSAFVPLAIELLEPLHTLVATDTAPLLRAVQDMHHAVLDAQCREPLPRWLGWLGTTRGSILRFQSDCREAMAVRPRIGQRSQRIAECHQPQAPRLRGDLDRLHDRTERLAAAVVQAQSLLARQWEDLRPQRPDPANPRSLDSLRAILAQVDGQRALLQRLDTACTGARDVVRLGRAVLDARNELLADAEGRLGRAYADWCARVAPLLRDGLQSSQLLASARDATAFRRGLLLALDQMRAVCMRLQIDEQALAHALAQLAEQLLGLLPADPDRTLPGRPSDTRGRAGP